MKNKIFKLLFILTFLVIPFNVFASNISGEIVANSDVTKGEQLKVAIKLLQEGDDKIDVFQGIVDFDENVFSGIDESSLELQNGWANFEYNKETHALIVINKYGSTLNEDIITFNLNLNSNVTPSSTEIGLKDMVVANDSTDTTLEDVKSKVNVNLIPNDITPGKKGETQLIKPLETMPVKIYYTLTLILLELMVAFVLLLLYRTASSRITTKLQKRALVLSICLVEVLALSVTLKTDERKGDLNSDKTVDYSDVQTLAQHVVNKNMLSNFKLEAADMNGDGKITASDIAILLQKTYNNTHYDAVLSDAILEDNAYEKNSVVDLRFLADVTNDEEIEFVLIGGKKYRVENARNNSKEYIIKMPLANVSKEYNYNVTEVILSNGRSAKVDYKTNVVVLKDAPTLTGVATKENLEDGTVSVALTINDNDRAIINSYYELVDSNGNQVEKGELNRGKNTLELSLNNAVNYKLNINIDYNRGMNSGEYYGSISDSYDLRIVTDYKFRMSNVKLVQNGVATKNLEKTGATQLEFNSTNISGYAPKKVNIGGKEYTVNRLGNNRYSVNIPNVLLNGAPITISKVILSNGKVILTKVSAKYNILSKTPIIENVSVREDISSSNMNVAFNIADEDKILNNVTVKLFDINGNLISSQMITDGDYNVNLETRDTSKYYVRIYASYSRLFGSNEFTYVDQLMYETSQEAQIKAYVNSNTLDNIYPEKNSIVKLNYNITSNYDDPVSKIIVNNIIYDARKVGTDNYQIELDVKDIAGVKDYNTQKIIFANGKEADVSSVVKLDVLKEYPVLDNLEVNENTEERKIRLTFDFFDKDGSFISGRVRLTNKSTGEEVASENIIIGKNSVEFTFENAIKYDIDVLIDAVLDTRTLNAESPNVVHDYSLYNGEYRIINDYQLNITDISTYREEEKVDFFNKAEKIKIGFTSTNVSEYIPVKVKVDGQYYDVNNNEGISTFEIEGFSEEGVKTLKFESIVLSNLKEIGVDVTKKIEILKDVPIVTESEVIENGNNIIVKLNIEDEQNILNNIKAIVTDSAGEEIFNGNIDNEITFEKKETSKYTIKVYGDYDLDSNELALDQNEYINQILFEKVIEKGDTV